MTTLAQARASVYTLFISDFDTLDAERITYDNETFDPPENGSWIRLVVRSTGRNQQTLGAVDTRRFRSQATVIAQVFTEANIGLSVSDGLVADVRQVFEGRMVDGVCYGAATTQEIGASGKWYQVLAEVPFDYDEIR